MSDNTSFAICYPVNGYQGGSGVYNPLDVVMYYLTEDATQDWYNVAIPLALSSAHVTSLFGCHAWVDGSNIQWAQGLADTQALSMQDLYDRHNRAPVPEHPVYSNAELTNIIGAQQVTLLTDPNQGNPHEPGVGIWNRMINGENIFGWTVVVQNNPSLWPADWPPTDPSAQSNRGKKK